MKKTTSILGAALLAAVGLSADESHTHKVAGTVGRVEKARFELKDAEGKVLSFALDERTKIERDGSASADARLEVGERVAIEYEEAGGIRVATKVRVNPPGPTGGAKTEAAYFCPMHPEVVSDNPGRCPRCNMSLEKRRAK